MAQIRSAELNVETARWSGHTPGQVFPHTYPRTFPRIKLLRSRKSPEQSPLTPSKNPPNILREKFPKKKMPVKCHIPLIGLFKNTILGSCSMANRKKVSTSLLWESIISLGCLVVVEYTIQARMQEAQGPTHRTPCNTCVCTIFMAAHVYGRQTIIGVYYSRSSAFDRYLRRSPNGTQPNFVYILGDESGWEIELKYLGVSSPVTDNVANKTPIFSERNSL